MTILAKATQAVARVEQLLFTVPADSEALCSVQVCNRGATTAKVRIGLLSSGEAVTANSGFIEFDTQIVANGILERTGIMLAAGEKIAVYSDTAEVVNYIVVGKTDLA